jgi:hypothetical protein
MRTGKHAANSSSACIGVEWKVTRRGKDPFNISVARRESVALMDEHVGAKY